MKIILDKNENAYYLDKTRNVKAPCVCTCTVLACDPWKGQRAQRAGLLLALQCSHVPYVSAWLCCKRRPNI